MSQQLLQQATQKFVRDDLPNFKVGDTIAVDMIIREGDKQRAQRFQGFVLSIKGKGINKTFTVRKLSGNVGVEKTIPFNSPNIEKIQVIKHGKTRRAKIYYMRERVGRLAMKIKPGKPAPVKKQKQAEKKSVEAKVSAQTESQD